MAWAIFHRESNWSRPRAKYSFNAKQSDTPQQRPRDFVDYCVSKGWAIEVRAPNKEAAAALKPRKRKA